VKTLKTVVKINCIILRGAAPEEHPEGLREWISASIIIWRASQRTLSEGVEFPEPDGQSRAATWPISAELH
jgi:hypothetical protein